MERRCLPFIDERHLERIGFGFKGAIVGGESRNLGEQRRGRKVRNARLFARSRELSHRSVSILPRVFVERGKKEGRRGGGARGKDRKKKKKNGHVSMQKHPAARISPLLIFPATFERSPLASSVSSFLSPLPLSPRPMENGRRERRGEGREGGREREREGQREILLKG